MSGYQENEPREPGTHELGLDEELSIEDTGSRVEGQAVSSGVNVIGSSNGVTRDKTESIVN